MGQRRRVAWTTSQLRFPADPIERPGSHLLANPGNLRASEHPAQCADIRHAFHDVFGVRLGGDYNLSPDQASRCARAQFFETQAADSALLRTSTFEGRCASASPRAAPIACTLWARRRRAAPLRASCSATGIVFFGALRNDRPKGGVNALSGAPCAMGAPSGGVCPDGTPAYRTPWPVNLGTITSAINVVNVGASYKF